MYCNHFWIVLLIILLIPYLAVNQGLLFKVHLTHPSMLDVTTPGPATNNRVIDSTQVNLACSALTASDNLRRSVLSLCFTACIYCLHFNFHSLHKGDLLTSSRSARSNPVQSECSISRVQRIS